MNIRNLFIFIILFSSPQVHSADWSQFYGCYQTLEVNGKTVAQIPENRGTIEERDYSELVVDLDRSEISTVAFYLFKNYRQGVSEFTYHDAFKDLGSYSQTGAQEEHRFSGKLLFTVDPSVTFDYDSWTSIERVSGDRLRVNLELAAKSSFFSQIHSDSFLLQRIDCL